VGKEETCRWYLTHVFELQALVPIHTNQ